MPPGKQRSNLESELYEKPAWLLISSKLVSEQKNDNRINKYIQLVTLCSLLDVALSLGAWITTIVFMKSGFYFWFWGPIVWISVLFDLSALPFRERQHCWCYEEFLPNFILAYTLKLECLRLDSFCCCCRRDPLQQADSGGTFDTPGEAFEGRDQMRRTTIQAGKRYILQWRAWRVWSIILTILIPWLRSLAFYCDTNGLDCFGNNPVGKSSCTRNLATTDSRYGVYNPNGFFPVAESNMEQFDPAQPYVFCAMYQRWAAPNTVTPYILGFTQTVVSDCSAAQGSPFYISLNPSLGCAFPNPASGIKPGLQGIQLGNTNASWEFCPGTLRLLGDPLVYGRPGVICPQNLNYWRKMSGQPRGPSVDYEIACPPYDANAPSNVFSWFCPGLGAGWLADEKYQPEDMTVAFWIITAYIFFWCSFVEPILFFTLFFVSLTPIENKKR